MNNKDRKNLKVLPYAGGNETIDRLRTENDWTDPVWIVEGVGGRKVILADTPAEAIEKYIENTKAFLDAIKA